MAIIELDYLSCFFPLCLFCHVCVCVCGWILLFSNIYFLFINFVVLLLLLLLRRYATCLRHTAKRPPVEETASFLQSLLASHGPNYLEKLFGSKARDALDPLGGVEKVAIALSESQTIEDFGAALHLMR